MFATLAHSEARVNRVVKIPVRLIASKASITTKPFTSSQCQMTCVISELASASSKALFTTPTPYPSIAYTDSESRLAQSAWCHFALCLAANWSLSLARKPMRKDRLADEVYSAKFLHSQSNLP